MSFKTDFTADFYGAIIGTAAAVALMVAAFFITPLFIAIPLLIIGILAITAAYFHIGIVKGNVLPASDQFSTHRASVNGNITTINVEHQTADGVTLRGIFEKNPRNLEDNTAQRSLAIYFTGNADDPHLYGPGTENIFDRNGNHISRFGFNEAGAPLENHDVLWMGYRGTCVSEGTFPTHEQNVSDAIEIYRRARTEGYTDITFVGVSFGGKVASEAKAQILADEDNSQDVPLVVAHTFSTMDEVISGHFEELPKTRENLRNITGWLIKTVGHQHDPVTTDDWHGRMGTRNVIIGGGRQDTLMNKHMGLADIFTMSADQTEAAQTYRRIGIQRIETIHETFENTKVIVQPAQHMRIKWGLLTELVREGLALT